jgi:TolB-like protein/Tfp pilus assembly protein PilF
LEKNSAARFHSAHDLAFALRAVLSDSHVGKSAAAPVRSRRIRWLAAAAVLVAVLAISPFLLLPFRQRPEPSAPIQRGNGFDSVAILPLANKGEAGGDLLCDGIARHVTDSLVQVRDRQLKVRPFTSTSHYKGQKANPQIAGRELDAQAVVVGELRQQGSDLAVNLELVDVRDQNTVWSKPYRSKSSDILLLQDEIARDIAVHLGLRLTAEQDQALTRRYTDDAQAWLLFLEGRRQWDLWTEEGLQSSIKHLQAAIDRDPKFALAIAWQAHAHNVLGHQFRSASEYWPRGKQLAAESLQIDDKLAEGHAALGAYYFFYERDLPAAKRALEQALKYEPKSSNSRLLFGLVRTASGDVKQALADAEQVVREDPLWGSVQWELAEQYTRCGQYDQAIIHARKTIELACLPGYAALGRALFLKGESQAAIDSIQQGLAIWNTDPDALGLLGYIFAKTGKPDQAQGVVNRLLAIPSDRPNRALALAVIHIGLGDKDQAFTWLRQSAEKRDALLVLIKVDRLFEDLRVDPRFDALLQDIGLAEKAAARDQPLDTLAVLPFENQSPDPEAGYLGDDITYSLTDSLMRVRELIVRPYGSASRYKPGSFDAKTAGRALQAQAVLRGSIEKRGEDVIIEVELMHVGEDRRLWGKRYPPSKLADRLALQQQIIQDVPEQLRLALTGQEKQALARLPTPNLKAHELYIQARLESNKRTRPSLEKSIDLFRQATGLDSNYALAWAGLAEAYRIFPLNTDSPPRDFMHKAKAAAIRALEIDDQLVEAHVALASIDWSYEWDWSEAERRFQRALALNPNSAWTHLGHSQLLRTLGRFDEAVVHSQRAQELDPLWLNARTVTGKHYYYARHYDAAIEQYRKTLDIDPNFWVPHLLLGQAFAQKGQYEEAIAQFQRVRQVSGANLEALASLGHVYAVMGKTVEAHQVLDELKSLSGQRYVPPFLFALIHAGLGEKDQAFIWLDKAYEDRNQLIVWMKDEPMFESLKGDPRFQKIIADMNFPR